MKKPAARIAVSAAALVVGLAVCFAFGTVWFMVVYTRNTGAIDFATALKWCVTPFVPFDLLKIVFALIISGRVRKLAGI